ncbi:MAG TPA: heavy-metal-associated domain-containing protein [Fimbriimonadaceae bacterium]|nr:heavy-metal-associated domain-containing protein [Fimbriimonadaceae bacterium]
MGWLLPVVALALLAPGEDRSIRPVTFLVQGMVCKACVNEVSPALRKLPSLEGLNLDLTPPIARFKISTDKVALQEVVLAIRSAGKAFDGKLIVVEPTGLSDKVLDNLDRAISAVPGVKNSGAPDEHGTRYITFDLSKRTKLGDLFAAARSAGVELSTPPAEPSK